MIWKRCPHHWPFVWESTGDRWIPAQMASDTVLSYFHWCLPQQTAEQIIVDDLRRHGPHVKSL